MIEVGAEKLKDNGVSQMNDEREGLFTYALEPFSGIERQSDGAVDRLRTLIITMDLEPGSLVDESALSQRLGYGRTPLREAFARLAEERMVVIQPHRSIQVAPVTIDDLLKSYEARLIFECAAARLAALNRTPQQVVALERLGEKLRQLSRSSDPQEFRKWAAVHFKFHYLLAEASENPYLSGSVRLILPTAMRLNYLLSVRGGLGSNRPENHVALIQAISARDAKAAEDAMRAHISGAKERIYNLL
jgi:DNA-binding GntR family transcriptional regulator